MREPRMEPVLMTMSVLPILTRSEAVAYLLLYLEPTVRATFYMLDFYPRFYIMSDFQV